MAGELLEMVLGGDKELIRRVTVSFIATINASFVQDKSRMTQNEIKRRFDICITALRELRADHGWAWTRILDAMPALLRSKLDGTPFDPAAQGTLWIA